MSEFLTDPSVLTKDKLKSALVANNVTLPNGDQRKGVYVELYLKNLTSQNKKTPDAFSSDDELEPTVSNHSLSGRKATKKSDRVSPEEIDVTALTNESLKEQLLQHGVNAGPIVASTRKVYEKKLQRVLEQVSAETLPPLSEHALSGLLRSERAHTGSGHNGTTHTERYSDTEADVEPEPDPEPEPVPVVERPVRSRGKPSTDSRTLSSQHRIEKLSYVEQTPKMGERNILQDMFPSENLRTPTGISATCRPPIKGASGRSISDEWLDDLRPRFPELRQTRSSYTESRAIPRVSAIPLPASRPTAPPAVQTKAQRHIPVWVRLLLLSAVAGFLFFVYQAMETNEMSPFGQRTNHALEDSSSK